MAKKETEKETKLNAIKDSRLQKYWRPAVAVIYLVICILDFAAMPIIYEVSRPGPKEAVELSMRYEPQQQVQALQFLQKDRDWEPLTLQGGGLFHLAFGAIVSGAAITRGIEKQQRLKLFQSGQMGQLGSIRETKKTTYSTENNSNGLSPGPAPEDS